MEGGLNCVDVLPIQILSSVAHSSPHHLKERVGNARTYIRPLQRDLDLSKVIDLQVG